MVARPHAVAERIKERLATLTQSERRAAQTLLGYYPMAGLESVTQFAKRAGVGAATILRLLAKLSFASYSEFQDTLRAELAARVQSPLWRVEGRVGSANDPQAAFVDHIAENLRDTLAHLPRDGIGRLVELLGQERRSVLIIGGRFTQALAQYLAVVLRSIRPRVHLVEGQSATWPDQLLDVGRADLVIALDIRRYQPDVAAFCKQAAGRGARVALLTDTWNSPIAGLADPVLPCVTDSPFAWDSLTAMFAVVEMILGLVSNAQTDHLAQRLRGLEDLRGGLRRSPDDGEA
jgi:DNA-binding MurR/RpiR family transcriptional regulator